ncbi:MAG: hypothetical protein AAB575_00840 [Patescibacteria group bacterium]
MKKINKILIIILILSWLLGPTATLALSLSNNIEQPTINQFAKPVVKFNPFVTVEPINGGQIEQKPVLKEEKPLPIKTNNPEQFAPQQPLSNQPFIPKQFYELKEKQNVSRVQVENTLNQPKEQSADGGQAFVLNAGEFLLRTIEMIVKQLEILRARILSEELASSSVFVASIKLVESDISRLQSISEKISNAQGDRQAIRDLAEEFRNFWAEHRFDGRLIAGRLMTFKMAKLFAKTNNLEVELSKQIEILKLRGADVSTLEGLMTDYRNKINGANGKLKQAQDLLTADAHLEGLIDNNQNKLMREASAQMAEARKILVKIINELKKRADVK